jgi:hypothetical protein
MRRVHYVQRPDMPMDGQGDGNPIICSFHALHYKITYELCVTSLFLFHVPHKRGAFENGFLCGWGGGWLFCDPVSSVVDCIALDGRMINEFEVI